MMYCNNCGHALPEGQRFCTGCGKEAPGAKPLACEKCGAVLEENVKFCNTCGTPVKVAGPLAEKRFCPYCGERFESDDMFCRGCGQGRSAVDENRANEGNKENRFLKFLKLDGLEATDKSQKKIRIMHLTVIALLLFSFIFCFIPVTTMRIWDSRDEIEGKATMSVAHPFSHWTLSEIMHKVDNFFENDSVYEYIYKEGNITVHQYVHKDEVNNVKLLLDFMKIWMPLLFAALALQVATYLQESRYRFGINIYTAVVSVVGCVVVVLYNIFANKLGEYVEKLFSRFDVGTTVSFSGIMLPILLISVITILSWMERRLHKKAKEQSDFEAEAM